MNSQKFLNISKPISAYLLIIGIAFLPLLSIFINSKLPHTSDGAMHVIRSLAYYKEFVEGQFPVRWTSQFHYGYGTMLFNFVYPLPYIATLPLIFIGVSPVLLLKLGFAFTYVLAGIGMYAFALRFFKDKQTAFIVTLLYQFAPFRFVEMMVRGNIGSLYAYAIAPFLFLGIYLFIHNNKYFSWLLICLSVALITLSHTIMGFAFLAVGGIFVLTLTKDFKKIALTYFAFSTGLAMSAFFILPGILEQKYTNGYLFTKDIFYHHFPSLTALFLPNFTDSPSLRIAEISVQIGLFQVLALALSIYIFLKKSKSLNSKISIGFLILVTILTIIFMQPIAKPLWENISFIRQFQFPWRFLGIITFTTAILGGYVLKNYLLLRKRILYITLCFLIIISTVYYWRPLQGYDNYAESFYWNYPITTNYFSEVNTIWMAEEPTSFPEKQIEILSGEANIVDSYRKSTTHKYLIEAKSESTILDRTYFFPGWKVYVNGNDVPIQFQDPAYAGMITFKIPRGVHNIEVKFVQSKLQVLGNYISLFTIILNLVILLIFLLKINLVNIIKQIFKFSKKIISQK